MGIYSMNGRFDSTFEEVDRQVQVIMTRLTARGGQYTAEFLFQLDFILRELFNNAIEHGNQMQPTKSVWYTLRIDGSDIELCIGDEGEGFDIARVLQQEYRDDILRVRKRGLATIAAMGFQITRHSGYTCVRFRGNPTGPIESEEAKSGIKLS